MINSNIWGLRPHLLQRSRFCFDEKSGGMPIWWVATETIPLHFVTDSGFMTDSLHSDSG